MLQSLGSALTSDKWTAAAVSQESQALDGESTRTKKKKKKRTLLLGNRSVSSGFQPQGQSFSYRITALCPAPAPAVTHRQGSPDYPCQLEH